MIAISEQNNQIYVCDDEFGLDIYTTEEFLNHALMKILERGEKILLHDMQKWSMCILNKFRECGLVDMTKNRLDNSSKRAPGRGEYTYILSADNGAFYSITVTISKKSSYIYESKNLVPVADDILMRDFETNIIAVALVKVWKMMHELGCTGSTISSCAFSLWKSGFDRRDFACKFVEPVAYNEFFRMAYHGGICMVGDSFAGRCVEKGIVLDANSLYPFVMKNFPMPYGKGKHGIGEIPTEYMHNSTYTYFVHFRAKFTIKDKHIAFARTKCDQFHTSFEYLRNSNYVDRNGQSYDEWVDEDGVIHKMMVEFCMYKAEFELFQEFYNIEKIEYIDYHVFNVCRRAFDKYIDFFYDMKKNARNAGERRIAKMFMNALSGRLGIIKNRCSAYLDRKSFESFQKSDLPNFAGYVDITSRSVSLPQVAAAITSEAMCYIVRKAQANFEHFAYSDTDSLHLDCELSEVKDIVISDELGDFKVEHTFTDGMYFKQKKYLFKENGKAKVTFAGMPEAARQQFEQILDKNYTVSVTKIYYDDYKINAKGEKITCRNVYPVDLSA